MSTAFHTFHANIKILLSTAELRGWFKNCLSYNVPNYLDRYKEGCLIYELERAGSDMAAQFETEELVKLFSRVYATETGTRLTPHLIQCIQQERFPWDPVDNAQQRAALDEFYALPDVRERLIDVALDHILKSVPCAPDSPVLACAMFATTIISISREDDFEIWAHDPDDMYAMQLEMRNQWPNDPVHLKLDEEDTRDDVFTLVHWLNHFTATV